MNNTEAIARIAEHMLIHGISNEFGNHFNLKTALDMAIDALEKEEEKNIMKLRDAVDNVFSHNEIVELFVVDETDKHYLKRIWRGMGHEIPEKYLNSSQWRIFGCIPENIYDADAIHVRLFDVQEEE